MTILLAVPFSLAGLDAETGVIMFLYVELAHDKWQKEGRLKSIPDLKEAIVFGAVKRIRPKNKTVCVILAGLIPIMFSHGAGSDVMKRIAAPVVGGVVASTILELISYPSIYLIWKGWGVPSRTERPAQGSEYDLSPCGANFKPCFSKRSFFNILRHRHEQQ